MITDVTNLDRRSRASAVHRPVLITNAARSQEEQFRSRQKRYVIMMSARVGCLVLGALLVGVHPPLLWVWLALCLAGMVLLPWVAVLVANDRPARSKAERAASEAADEQRQQAAIEQHPVDREDFLTIDSDVVREPRAKHSEGRAPIFPTAATPG